MLYLNKYSVEHHIIFFSSLQLGEPNKSLYIPSVSFTVGAKLNFLFHKQKKESKLMNLIDEKVFI